MLLEICCGYGECMGSLKIELPISGFGVTSEVVDGVWEKATPVVDRWFDLHAHETLEEEEEGGEDEPEVEGATTVDSAPGTGA